MTLPYTEGVVRTLTSAVRFWWRASAGHRFRPWRSPYLRWRMETYSGKKAETLRLKDFLSLAFAERRQVWRFLAWVRQINRLAANGDTH